MASTDPVDVLIIGGGPAGLAAAATLARQQHTVLVFDSHKYRNDPTEQIHAVPTWDYRSPADFRAESRKGILDNYTTVSFRDAKISAVRKLDNDSGFEVTEADGGKTHAGRKLVLATGVADEFPDVKGYAEAWGKGIFHCLFCHGYEQRGGAGTSAGVLAVQLCASPPHAAHMARNALQLVSEVTVYTDGDEELAGKIRAIFEGGKGGNFKVDSRKVKHVERAGKGVEVVVAFEDGSEKTETFLVHNPKTHATQPFVQQLGLESTPGGDIKVSPPFQQTSVKGVFAAGDGQTPFKIVPQALASGSMCAAGVAAQLQAEKYGHPSLF